MRGGLRSTSFKPGVSGNPGGRPKTPQAIAARRIFVNVKALARECAPEAISTLKTIMLDAKAPPAARIGAATALLDRGYGKPNQTIDLTTVISVFDLSKLSDDELEQFEALILLVAGPAIEQGAVECEAVAGRPSLGVERPASNRGRVPTPQRGMGRECEHPVGRRRKGVGRPSEARRNIISRVPFGAR